MFVSNCLQMAKRYYDSQTLIDNWQEENYDKTEREKMLLKKIGNEELLIQKVKKLQLNVNNKRILSVCPYGYVKYGNTIQIHHNPNGSKYCLAINLARNIVLGNALDLKNLFPCGIKLSDASSSALSSFTIQTDEKSKNIIGMPLQYGQNFYLTIKVMKKDLYLTCRSSTSGGITNCKASDLFLIENPSLYSLWKVQHINREWRLEYLGCNVPVHEDVIIVNQFTNQSLSIKTSDIKIDSLIEMAPFQMNKVTSHHEKWKIMVSL